MKAPRILLVYKLSSLAVAGKLSARLRTVQRFQDNHQAHYASIHQVERTLKDFGLKYHKHERSPRIDYKPYDLIITVGGDGTLLEAARALHDRQTLLGVNSDPDWSVGQFCCTDSKGLDRILKRFLAGKAGICQLHKLRLRLEDGKKSRVVECLNDVLICHANPAAMSRYTLIVGKISEGHRSSGIWFSTAAGSTGAMYSAGGKKMPICSTDIQYKPRELYHAKKSAPYHLTGGLIKKPGKACLVSLMPRGRVFVDGAHVKFPFTYGSRAEISSSPNFVQLVHE